MVVNLTRKLYPFCCVGQEEAWLVVDMGIQGMAPWLGAEYQNMRGFICHARKCGPYFFVWPDG